MCTLWTAIVAAELASQNRSACFGVKNYDFTKIRDICNSWKRNTAEPVNCQITMGSKQLEKVYLIPPFAVYSHHYNAM